MAQTVKPTSTAEAHTLKLRAQQLRMDVQRFPDYNPGINRMDMRHADTLDAAAGEFLALPQSVTRGTGGELCKPGTDRVMKEPDRVALEASTERVRLVDECGAFNLALDLTETIKPKNASEQMLAHQLAAAHKAALDLLAKSAAQHDTIERARLSNAAARLMSVFQQGLLTLQRLRTNGNQTVTVQHVHVEAGGQATAVIGNVQAGARLREGGDGQKNEE